MSDDSDPYLYPGTDVLKNVPDLRDSEQLAAFEALNTAARAYELLQNPIAGEFDIAHLKAIHRHIFRDVFTWAGELRTTVLGKAEYLGQPPTWFTPPTSSNTRQNGSLRLRIGRIYCVGSVGSSSLANLLNCLQRSINFIPSGRGTAETQRLFVDALVRQAGHELHFDVVSRERMVQASIEAKGGNLGMMTRMFEEITNTGRIQPLRRAIAFLSREKFNWNDTYIATTTAAESYSGKLVGRDGEAFMMRSDDNRILIGRAVDIDPAARSGERIAFRAAT